MLMDHHHMMRRRNRKQEEMTKNYVGESLAGQTDFIHWTETEAVFFNNTLLRSP